MYPIPSIYNVHVHVFFILISFTIRRPEIRSDNSLSLVCDAAVKRCCIPHIKQTTSAEAEVVVNLPRVSPRRLPTGRTMNDRND
jgi:hypothetical protein